MALTITNRGTGTHNTGATTLVAAPTSTIAAGSMGILAVALDNAGSAGATKISPASVTDSVGNKWTLRQNPLYDNGGPSAGIEGVIYTAHIVTQLTSGNDVTITWSPAASPVAKAYTFTEVTPGAGNRVEYLTGGTLAGATAANATVSAGTVTSGDVVFGAYFAENVNAVTADSDSTNGSWSTQQTATIGTTTSGVRIASQGKVTTGTGTQSYDVTVASQDRTAAWITLDEVAITVAGSLTADAVLRKEVSTTFTADAVLVAAATTVGGSFTADAVLLKNVATTVTADAILRQTIQPSLLPARIVADTPVSYWRFGETAAGAAVDEMGVNNGAPTATVGYGASGPWAGNPAYSFDGSQQIEVAHHSSLNVGDNFSLRVAFKRGTSGVFESMMGKGNTSFKLQFGSDDAIYLVSPSVANIAHSSTTYGVDGLWHYVIATKNGSAVKLWIDGADVTVLDVPSTVVQNTGNVLGIGSNYFDEYFTGSLDEVAIYNYALTAAQVAAQVASDGSFLADAILRVIVSSTFAADAVLFKTVATTVTADSVLKKEVSATLTADAIMSKAIAFTFTADAALRIVVPANFSADATLRQIVEQTYTADAVILKAETATFTADAYLVSRVSGSFTADAVLRKESSSSWTADAILNKPVATTLTADAVLRGTAAGSFTTDAVLRAVPTGSLTADAVLMKVESATITADAILSKSVAGTLTSDAVLLQTVAASMTADAIFMKVGGATFTADAFILSVGVGTFTADAVIVGPDEVASSFTADAILLKASEYQFTANAALRRSVTLVIDSDAVLRKEVSGSWTADAVLNTQVQNQALADAIIQRTVVQTFTADAVLDAQPVTVEESFTADAWLVSRVSGSFSADAVLVKSISSSFTADAWIQSTTGNLPFEIIDAVDETLQIITSVALSVLDTEFEAGDSITITTSIEESLSITDSVGRV